MCTLIAALSGAIMRVSATLDVTTVLQEIVDSARGLTGAGLSVITTIDADDEVEWFWANKPVQVRAGSLGPDSGFGEGGTTTCREVAQHSRAGGAKRQPPERA